MTAQGSDEAKVLVVDDDELFRTIVTKRLEHAGLGAVSVESYDRALAVLENTPNIEVLLLDHPSVGSDVGAIVNSVRKICSDMIIVGNSGADRRSEFAAAGVSRYLQKPWRVEDLLAVVREKIIACVECCLPLPLLRPRTGEAGEGWVCAFCGCRYNAILDHTAAPEMRSHVIRSDEL